MRFWFGLATAPLVWSEVDDDTVALLQGRRNVIEAGERQADDQADDREAVVVDNLDQTAAKKGPPPRPPPPQRPVAPPPPVPKPEIVDPIPPNVGGLHNGGCPAQNTFCANQLNWPPNCDVPVAGCPDNWNMGACRLDPNAKFPAGLMCHDPHVVNVTRSSARTQAKYAAVAASVVELVEGIADKSCTNDRCPQAEFSACVLRMSGHDFMDFDGSNGGSDGCVDFADPDNIGLKPCLVNGETHGHINLNKAFAAHAASVSLADFLVIAGEAVMAHERHNEPFAGGKNLGDEFKKRFQWGRVTNHNCGNQKHLPLPQESCEANEKTFVNAQTGLGLSWRETAALMGVHSLGRAREANSGYDGWWSDFKSAGHFNNNYYHSLALKGWTPFQLKSGKWQWIRSGMKSKRPGFPDAGSDEMMLNTDMCLLYKFANGQDIKSEPQFHAGTNQSCCAWLMPQAFTSHGLNPSAAVGHVQNKIDRNQWCGFPSPSGGFGATKHWCCNMGRVHTGRTDCNNMAGGGAHGVAAKDVLEFAANEDAWINTFLDAWNKATEKGM